MKRITKITTVLLLCLSLNTVIAQELPQPSPAATVIQRVGLTDVTVVYSRPRVKGRTIWGDLVPYDKIWRTGANKATMISFSTNVKINENAIKAGDYALYTIPGKTEWAVILNSNTDSWGTGSYDEKTNVAKFTVKPTVIPNVESLRYSLEDVAENSANITISWEKLAIAFKVEVDVHEAAMKNIEAAIKEANGAWATYRSAAKYTAQSGQNLDKGIEWINKSIAMNSDSWYSYWVKADVLAARKDGKGAVAAGKRAIEIGEIDAKAKSKDFKYKEELEKNIKKWSVL